MSKIDRIKAQVRLDRITMFNQIETDEKKKTRHEFKKLDILLGKKVGHGANVDVYLPEKLDCLYGRKNLCLKVFRKSKLMWGSVCREGYSPIYESTIVQNLMALRGLAPRVYDIINVNGKTAQVTDYLVGQPKVATIVDDRFSFNQNEIKKPYNFIDGKLIDFQAVIFKNFIEYKKSFIRGCLNITQFPQGHGGLYQSLDYHAGKRNTKERLARYKFKDFKNKKVLDIGCNLGLFSRASCDLGAKRVVGIDWSGIAEKSAELAILDGYFNIDFYGVDLRDTSWADIIKMTGIEKFDIGLFLAMECHVGKPEWLKNFDTLIYEGHGQELARTFKIIDNKSKILS